MPGTVEMFQPLTSADQTHAIDVAMELAQHGVPPELVYAGLLHDIGKVQDPYRITIAHRIIHVLPRRCALGMIARLRRSLAPRRGTRALWALSVHDLAGAPIVHDLGYGERVQWLVRQHQVLDPDEPDLVMLQVVDNRVPRRPGRYNYRPMVPARSDGPPTLCEYQLRLPSYEGPLDVLLRLIERSQLAIEDVSLVAVTHQFLSFIEGLVEASPDVVAEFTAVGARLTLLKSRSLLPRPPDAEEDAPESDLTQQLRDFQRVKLLAAHLREAHAAGTASYSSLHGAVARPTAIQPARLARQDPSVLIRSLRRRLSMVPRPATIIQQRPVVTLREVVAHVSDCVGRLTCVRFSTVVQEYRSRTEVATGFLAILVLVRRQAIVATQGDIFSDIELNRLPALDRSFGIANGQEDDARLFSYETGTH